MAVPEANLFMDKQSGKDFERPQYRQMVLVFRHKGQHLEDNIAEEGPHQVFAPASVQQRHVQHHNVNPAELYKQAETT